LPTDTSVFLEESAFSSPVKQESKAMREEIGKSRERAKSERRKKEEEKESTPNNKHTE